MRPFFLWLKKLAILSSIYCLWFFFNFKEGWCSNQPPSFCYPCTVYCKVCIGLPGVTNAFLREKRSSSQSTKGLSSMILLWGSWDGGRLMRKHGFCPRQAHQIWVLQGQLHCLVDRPCSHRLASFPFSRKSENFNIFLMCFVYFVNVFYLFWRIYLLNIIIFVFLYSWVPTFSQKLLEAGSTKPNTSFKKMLFLC